MILPYNTLIRFWITPWSEPFRAACLWFTLETQPLRGHLPNTAAPKRLRPFFLHRWVGETIAARLAWLTLHPEAEEYRFGNESEPCYEDVAWQRYPGRILRKLSEERLVWIFGMEVERLLRIAQEHPSLVGQGEWTSAALGASEHLAQLYAELKRRHKAAQARALLRADLDRFIEWQPDDNLAPTPND